MSDLPVWTEADQAALNAWLDWTLGHVVRWREKWYLVEHHDPISPWGFELRPYTDYNAPTGEPPFHFESTAADLVREVMQYE